MKESLDEFNKATDDNVILSYLFQLQKELLEEKNSLVQQIEAIDKNINELQNSVSSITSKTDPGYNLFSPNTIESSDIQSDLSNEIYSLNESKNMYTIMYEKVENRLQHIKDIISWSEVKAGQNYDYLIDSLDITESLSYENYRLNLLQTQEIERNRIARELHDTTVQNLTNIVHKTELCTKLVDIDTVRTKLELQTMISTIRTTIKDMRSIIYNLMPMSLEDLGLQISIDQLANQIMQNNNVKVKLDIEDTNIKVPSIVNLTLFRIIQESCNNALKHAKAKEIKINLNYNNKNINLEIEDDGIGFDLKSSVLSGNNISSNFGLSIMRERVYLLSGHIKIDSKKNMGTKIRVTVPINNFMEGKNDTN